MSLIRFARGCLWSAALLSWLGATATADQGRLMIEAQVDGRKVLATPLAWGDNGVVLLERDGSLWRGTPGEIASYQAASATFSPLTAGQLAAQLAAEFGGGLEVSSVSQGLVLHPRGEGAKWTARFEQMYRSIDYYFRVRGFPARRYDFPLVAIVWPDQESFVRFSMRDGTPAGPGVLGYYSLDTNRIAMFNSADFQKAAGDWRDNVPTLVHEAAHQVAFNCGVHSRWSPPPRWLAEGLGTLFEARGVYNAEQYPNLADRINRDRLAGFRETLSADTGGASLVALIESDELFQRNPAAAYALSWALTFYLVETRPREYCAYLTRTGSRAPFSEYSRAQRAADFAAHFGRDYRMLEAQLLRYFQELK